jgi:carotenoid 1,2-hydratase
MNTGAEPIEAGFTRWNWSREDAAGETRIHYDVTERDGSGRGLALAYLGDGTSAAFTPSPLHVLPKTGWRVERAAHAAGGHRPHVARTLEDTPFYSRSILDFPAGSAGNDDAGGCRAIHETVDLDRFRAPWVQAMLPFKMPRRAG